MERDPFDLTFEDLEQAGVLASHVAQDEAVRAGVPVATLNTPGASRDVIKDRKDPSREPVLRRT